jgi:hypothetical protein
VPTRSATASVAPGYFLLVIAQASGQAGKSGQLAALIQQRIRHINRRQRPTPLLSRTAESRHQSQLGVDGFGIAYARSVGPRADGGLVESGVQDKIGGLAAEARPGLDSGQPESSEPAARGGEDVGLVVGKTSLRISALPSQRRGVGADHD